MYIFRYMLNYIYSPSHLMTSHMSSTPIAGLSNFRFVGQATTARRLGPWIQPSSEAMVSSIHLAISPVISWQNPEICCLKPPHPFLSWQNLQIYCDICFSIWLSSFPSWNMHNFRWKMIKQPLVCMKIGALLNPMVSHNVPEIQIILLLISQRSLNSR